MQKAASGIFLAQAKPFCGIRRKSIETIIPETKGFMTSLNDLKM
jgi:hypothetical protein